jgi:hypothetical protein
MAVRQLGDASAAQRRGHQYRRSPDVDVEMAETAPMRMESPSVEPRLTGLLGSIANTASEPAALTRCDGSTPISELLPAPGRPVTPTHVGLYVESENLL